MDHVELPSLSRLLIGVIILKILCVTLVRYLAAAFRAYAGETSLEIDGRPPLAPKAIPFLGHMPLRFLWDPLGFAHTYVDP